MMLKLTIITVYALAVLGPTARFAGQTPSQVNCKPADACNDPAAQIKKLDPNGERGMVCFRHKTHEAYSVQDPNFAHQTGEGATCIGCHHKRSEATGVPILAKCTTCHRNEGDPANPRNRDMDEVWSERAFHQLCIDCHRASNAKAISKCKAPIACSECHAAR
jgi:hypothetical protein